MDVFMESLLEAVLIILGVIVSFLVSYYAPKIKKFLADKIESDNTGILATLAEQAVELIEARFEGVDGNEKFEEALAMLSRRLERKGIDMDEESMRMAIQKGWRAMNDKQKGDK